MKGLNELFLKAKTVSERAQKGYKVYSDKTNFTIIEAATVAEALEKSGVKSPYKIIPAFFVSKNIFSQAEISEMQKEVAPASGNSPA